jgi:hypothetical protein
VRRGHGRAGIAEPVTPGFSTCAEQARHGRHRLTGVGARDQAGIAAARTAAACGASPPRASPRPSRRAKSNARGQVQRVVGEPRCLAPGTRSPR